MSKVGTRSVLVFVTETRSQLPRIKRIVMFEAFGEPEGVEDAITDGPPYEGPAITDDSSGSGE